MKPLLLVMNPRAIDVCIDAIAALDIDRVWLKNYTEGQLVDVIEDVIDACDHDPIGLVSDDGIPTQDALDLVLSHYSSYKVFTGYCNIDTESTLVNLSMQPLIVQDEADIGCYTMPHREEIETHSSPLIRSWFAGFALTFMSRELWRRYPGGELRIGREPAEVVWDLRG